MCSSPVVLSLQACLEKAILFKIVGPQNLTCTLHTPYHYEAPTFCLENLKKFADHKN